jgi:ABC-2 type transport system permease protein
LAASAGRGYLLAVGALLLAVVAAQVVAALGWGAFFPWAVPALASGVAGQGAEAVGAGSYALVLLTGAAGVAGTVAWWRLADQP